MKTDQTELIPRALGLSESSPGVQLHCWLPVAAHLNMLQNPKTTSVKSKFSKLYHVYVAEKARFV